MVVLPASHPLPPTPQFLRATYLWDNGAHLSDEKPQDPALGPPGDLRQYVTFLYCHLPTLCLKKKKRVATSDLYGLRFTIEATGGSRKASDGLTLPVALCLSHDGDK